MKTAVIYAQRFMNRPYIPLPNAATRRQVLKKALDGLLDAHVDLLDRIGQRLRPVGSLVRGEDPEHGQQRRNKHCQNDQNDSN